MARGIRARLERLEREHEESAGAPLAWDALAEPGGFPRFVASLPADHTAAVAEARRAADADLAAVLARIASATGYPVTARDLGMLAGPADLDAYRTGTPPGPPSGFVTAPARADDEDPSVSTPNPTPPN